jgi:hypothetical protein
VFSNRVHMPHGAVSFAWTLLVGIAVHDGRVCTHDRTASSLRKGPAAHAGARLRAPGAVPLARATFSHSPITSICRKVRATVLATLHSRQSDISRQDVEMRQILIGTIVRWDLASACASLSFVMLF